MLFPSAFSQTRCNELNENSSDINVKVISENIRLDRGKEPEKIIDGRSGSLTVMSNEISNNNIFQVSIDS